MSDNKKEQERAEPHRSILGIANDQRGSVDGWGLKRISPIEKTEVNKVYEITTPSLIQFKVGND